MSGAELSVRCCIAGGGPAGMMLGLLLARGGVPTREVQTEFGFEEPLFLLFFQTFVVEERDPGIHVIALSGREAYLVIWYVDGREGALFLLCRTISTASKARINGCLLWHHRRRRKLSSVFFKLTSSSLIAWPGRGVSKKANQRFENTTCTRLFITVCGQT